VELRSYRPEGSAAGPARLASRRRRFLVSSAWLGGSLVGLLFAVPMCAGARGGATDGPVNAAHLEALRVPLRGGRAVWAAAWQGKPLPDPDTGILARTEDVARVASFYLEAPADPRRRAAEALESLLVAQTADGRFAYGLSGDGSPTGPVGLDWPASRAFWALATAARVLPGADPLRARVLDAAELSATAFGRARDGAGLISGSAAQTGAVVLGLAELARAGRSSPLLAEMAEAIGQRQAGEPGLFPYQAHLPTRNPALWHAYGAYQVAALAEAGMALARRDFLAGAEREAAAWSVHVLIAGGPIWGFAPAPRTYPQIAYNLEPTVRGLLALGRATRKDAYFRLAGLHGAWLLGDNATGRPVYDQATGRVSDGLGPGGAGPGAGCEATALGLAALQLLQGQPIAARYLAAREGAAQRAFAARATSGPRGIRGSGPYAGSWFALLEPGKPVAFPLGGDGALLLSPIFLRGQAEPGAAGALELSVGGRTERFPLAEPGDTAIGPVLEVGRMAQVFDVRAGERAIVRLGAGSTVPVALDGVLCQPVVEFRTWTLGRGRVAVVKSLSGKQLPLQYAWPGAAVDAYLPSGRQVRAGEDLEPYGYALIESGG